MLGSQLSFFSSVFIESEHHCSAGLVFGTAKADPHQGGPNSERQQVPFTIASPWQTRQVSKWGKSFFCMLTKLIIFLQQPQQNAKEHILMHLGICYTKKTTTNISFSCSPDRLYLPQESSKSCC